MEPTADRGEFTAAVKRFWRRVLRSPSPRARIEVYGELAPLVAAGIGVRDAVRREAERHSGAKRRLLAALDDGLARDVPPSETMRAHPEVFSALEAAIVATGERTGRLDVAFREAARQIERAKATRDRTIQACIYPLFVLHFLIAGMTLGTIAASRGMGAYFAFVVPTLALLWGAILGAVSVHAGLAPRPGYERFLRALPVVGRIRRASGLARFARAFSALHGAGVPYDACLRTAADASGDAALREETYRVAPDVARGDPLPSILSRIASLPPDTVTFLAAGEHAGDLEMSLARVADMEDERAEVAVRRLLSVLPGILIAIVGLIVAWVVIGYYASVLGRF